MTGENMQPLKSPADERSRRAIRGQRDLSIPVARDPDIILDRNLVVRAGAGSGKTTALVERMIALVRSGVPVERIVAITFTRRAAGELQERFLSGLRCAQETLSSLSAVPMSTQIEVDEDDRELLGEEAERVHAALEGDEQPFINTIHAFCARLLRARAFEAGLTPDFEQIEEAEEELIRRDFWSSFVARARRDGDPNLQILLDADISTRDLFGFFGELSARPDATVRFASTEEKPDLSSAAREAHRYLEKLSAHIPDVDRPDPFMIAVEQALRMVRIRGIDEHMDQAAFLNRIEGLLDNKGKLIIKSTYWDSSRSSDVYKFATDLRDGEESIAGEPFVKFIELRVGPVLRDWRVWLHGCAHRLAGRAVEDYRSYRLEQGKLTYGDLLVEAAGLMEQHDDARRFAQRAYSRILVDEFQDTDPVQARMLFRLMTDPENSGTGSWLEAPLAPGGLFLVGDDKQSIYRFRRADFQMFSMCADSICRQGGEILELTSNFRSDPELCHWINEAMGPVFDGQEAPYQAPYRNLAPFFGEFASKPVVMPIYLQKDGRKTASVIQAEALRIAEEIQNLKGSIVRKADGSEKRLGFGDFMILVRRGTYVPVYVSMLAEHGIPVGIAGGKAENASDTIGLTLDLMRAVYDSSDGISLAATLTGPFFGISDQEMLDYREAGGRFVGQLDDLEKLDGEYRGLRRGRSILRDFRDSFLRQPPYAALSGCLMRHGMLAELATRSDGDLAAGILVRLLVLVRSWEMRGWNWGECIEELDRYRDGDLDLDVHSLSTPYSDRARVMTIHQAKGLQADVVFLADPKAGNGREPTLHTRRDDSEFHLSLPVSRQNPYGSTILLEPDSWKEDAGEERLYEEAESKRLLYVACTRARRRLYVSLMDESGSSPYEDLRPMLETCGESIGPVPPVSDAGSVGIESEDESREYAEKLTAVVKEKSSRIGELSHVDWRVELPSDVSHSLTSTESGFGREYGIAIHHLFESLVARRKDDVLTRGDVAKSAAKVLEAVCGGTPDDSLVREAARAGWAFVTSDVWASIASSPRVLTEVPFTVSLDRNGVDVVLSGVVDLAFQEESVWKLLDYKTDRLTRDKLQDLYSRQLEDYREAWTVIFGDLRVAGFIWSTEHDSLVPVLQSQEPL